MFPLFWFLIGGMCICEGRDAQKAGHAEEWIDNHLKYQHRGLSYFTWYFYDWQEREEAFFELDSLYLSHLRRKIIIHIYNIRSFFFIMKKGINFKNTCLNFSADPHLCYLRISIRNNRLSRISYSSLFIFLINYLIF